MPDLFPILARIAAATIATGLITWALTMGGIIAATYLHHRWTR